MSSRSLRRLAGRALAVVLAASAGPAAKAAEGSAPAVVASIKPVHALVAAVMNGVGEPALLVRGAASPHSYAMRPSDARRLARADVVFWIGSPLETFLERPLSVLDPQARIVRLLAAPGVETLPARAGGLFTLPDEGTAAPAKPARQPEAEGEREAHGHGASLDAHLWLDPNNARAMARAAAAALAAADPAHADIYEANATRLDARIAALDDELARRLAPVRSVPYLVYHDAYQYLERHFGMNALGAVTSSPERPPGARRIRELREAIRAAGARCVFTEPQFTPALARVLAEETGARMGVLDPLGVGLPPGPEAYFSLMRELAENLVACLSAGEAG